MPIAAGTLRVPVTLRLGAEAAPRHLTLKLIRTPAGWRIADVASPEEPSLLADLTAWNRKHGGGASGARLPPAGACARTAL